MNTPICDFLKEYLQKSPIRLHMPGHKGVLSPECALDITEVEGADSLYHADGIIKESEDNLAQIFGTGSSFYSCEGSSLAIRAMLLLAMQGKRDGYVLATRNAHSSFISASVLLGFDVRWLYSDNCAYLSSSIQADELENALRGVDNLPFAMYVTSPDYLGNVLDIASLSNVCQRYGVPLLVDNAHGAYLRFLGKHPIELGATMCCDSAHKTLPVLTGGAYLHISKNAPLAFKENAKNALCLFGSTSPSYLILNSLDSANKYMSQGYKKKLFSVINKLDLLKKRLKVYGFELCGDEKLKLTIKASSYGYTGDEIASILYRSNIVCEFHDRDYLVLMVSSETTDIELERLESTLSSIERRSPLTEHFPTLLMPRRVYSPREAYFMNSEVIPTSEALGRVLSEMSISCPPAVSVAIPGEEINESIISICNYYKIDTLCVIKS